MLGHHLLFLKLALPGPGERGGDAAQTGSVPKEEAAWSGLFKF